MKKLDESLSSFVPVFDTDSYDEAVQMFDKEDDKVLKVIVKDCKREGIEVFYRQEDGTIVVDYLHNLVK